MNRVALRRAAAAAVIAAALAAGTPAHAAIRPDAPAAVSVLERAWQWIASFWGEEKNRGGFDPDGTPVPTAPGTCGPACEIGIMIDPNG